MRPALARRQAALAAVALLAVLGALALERSTRDERTVPTPPAAGGVQWEDAVAGIISPDRYGETTECEVVLERETRGVAHPVLPCGVDLVLEFDGVEAPAEVIARGPFGPGREFDLTQAVADDLGLEQTTTIRWRFGG